MIIRASILVLMLAALLQAQTFDAVSIKMSTAESERGSEGGPGTSRPGEYTFGKATLGDFIATAYDVSFFQVSSKAPLDKERFDLVAKVPAGATKDQFRTMLKNMLVERFHLKLQTIQKEFDAYELQVAKTGPKLKVSDSDLSKAFAPGNGFPTVVATKKLTSMMSNFSGHTITRMTGRQATLANIASMLRVPDERPIVDRTNLSGTYDFTLEFANDTPGAVPDAASAPPSLPDMESALRQQLGLLLVRAKAPFDVLVIESFDQRPTDN